MEEINDGATPQDFKIKNIIRHPLYKRSSNYHDIALFELEDIIEIRKNLRPACLWTDNEFNATKGWVTGWGHAELGKVFLIFMSLNNLSIRR